MTAKKIPMAKRNLDLVVKLRAGDLSARTTLVELNQGLVTSISLRYRSKSMTADDLIGVGNIGLLYAIDTYKPEMAKRCPFPAFAGRCIAGYVLRAIATDQPFKMASSRALSAFWKYNRAVMELEEAGRPTDPDAVAVHLNVPTYYTWTVVANHSTPAPMDTLPDRDDMPTDHRGYMVDTRSTPDVAVEQAEWMDVNRKRLHVIIGTFTQREQDVLYARKLSEQPQTLVVIGKRWGLTRERVRQVEVRALAKLGRAFEKYRDAAWVV
jgi:RNA polymerase sigma factor (sigma-70 family)